MGAANLTIAMDYLGTDFINDVALTFSTASWLEESLIWAPPYTLTCSAQSCQLLAPIMSAWRSTNILTGNGTGVGFLHIRVSRIGAPAFTSVPFTFTDASPAILYTRPSELALFDSTSIMILLSNPRPEFSGLRVHLCNRSYEPILGERSVFDGEVSIPLIVDVLPCAHRGPFQLMIFEESLGQPLTRIFNASRLVQPEFSGSLADFGQLMNVTVDSESCTGTWTCQLFNTTLTAVPRHGRLQPICKIEFSVPKPIDVGVYHGEILHVDTQRHYSFQFDVIPDPITTVVPTSGDLSGGTAVIVSITKLNQSVIADSGGDLFLFVDGILVSANLIKSEPGMLSCEFITPPGQSTGTVSITLSLLSPYSAPLSQFEFEYVTKPATMELYPAFGSIEGGVTHLHVSGFGDSPLNVVTCCLHCVYQG